MNRKTKKRIGIAAVLLFFLAAGVWYVFLGKEILKKQSNEKELVSVLNVPEADVTVAATLEPADSGVSGESESNLIVYVCGAVNKPGIYTLPVHSRLYEAITMAGGFSPEADTSYHNLARSITDGERIYIRNTKETEELALEQQVAGEEGATTDISETGMINLNTATMELLMELPGIGEAKAGAIIEYRNRIGAFTDIEEIKNVSGIGDAMFEKIKEKISVK